MLNDLEIQAIQRIANDAPLIAALRKFFGIHLKDAERLGADLSLSDEIVGQNGKAALIAEKRLSEAFDALASYRDTYTQPDDAEHV